MSKKALVLNGFAGGINKDSDATDLPAEGRGKDQVVSLKNMLADRGGKLRMRRYSSASHTYAGGTTTNGKNDLLIFDDKEYHEQGLYKVGKDVNWSGAISAVKPTALGHTDAQAASIGIGPSFSTKDLYSLFMGAGATNSTSTNPLFGNVATTSYKINDFIRVASEGGTQNGLFGEGYTRWDSFYGVGNFNDIIYNVDMTSAGNYETTSDADGMTEETSGLRIPHNVGHTDGSGDEFFRINASTVAIRTNAYYQMEFTVSGTFETNDDLQISLRCGSTIIKDFTIEATGKQSVSFSGGSTVTGEINFLIGRTDTVTATNSNGYFEITGMRLYSYGGGGDSSASVTKATLQDASGSSMDTYTGAAYGVDPIEDIAYNTTAGQKITASKQLNDDDNIALVFRVGYTNLYGSNANGIAGTGLDVTDQDLYIEVNADPGGALGSTSDFESLNIILNSDDTDYEISEDSGGSTRVYSLSQAELNANGAWRSKGRIKLPESSATHTGGNFDPTNVLIVGVIARVNTSSTGWNHSAYDLYELSFATSGALGWTESKVQFLESDTRNNSESLTSSYTTTIEADEKNLLSINIYEPTTAGYTGNLYFQTLDDSDGVSTNARFLLAKVDKDRGAKKMGATEWTPWSSNKVAFSFSNIPRESTFELESGYPERTEHVNAIWETAATNGRQVYIGNIHSPGITTQLKFAQGAVDNIEADINWAEAGFSVGDVITTSGAANGANNGTFKITTLSGDDISLQTEAGGGVTLTSETVTCNVGVRDTDRILKTPIGKLYGFSDLNFVDLELGAGTIKVLKTSGDRLLVFSEDTLTVLNIAQDYEYLEATLPGYGVDYSRQVTQVEEGVAFVNSSGVFFFDGNKINNLSAGLLDSLGFSNTSRIGYEPIEKMILVWKDGADDEVFGYSLKTNSWVTEVDNMELPITNSVAYKSNMYFVNDSNALQKVSNGTTVRTIELETGRISCGSLAIQKSFKAVYVTVTNNGGSPQTLTVDWAVDGGSYTGSPSTISGNGRIKIKVNAKGQDIQFKFAGTNTPYNFEISDIQLVYRDKKVK